MFAPLRNRVFAWLWIGVVASSIGSFAQTVGAQWLFIQDPGAATIVSLVAAANALPVMLLALPAGVISDAFDRRRLMIGIQVCAISIAVLLAVLAWRRPSIASAQRERFLPALRSGARYVRHEPHVCTILVRVVLFVAPATALWALLTKGVGGGP